MRSAVLCVWDVICIGCKTEKAFLFWTLKAFALLGLPVSMDWAEYVEATLACRQTNDVSVIYSCRQKSAYSNDPASAET